MDAFVSGGRNTVKVMVPPATAWGRGLGFVQVKDPPGGATGVQVPLIVVGFGTCGAAPLAL
jgi:hypothetical protein